MWKWLVLAVVLLACSGGDELEAPLLGDCANCNSAPSPGGGISGGNPDAGPLGDDAAGFDVGLDALDIVEVGVNLDAPINP
jgi:hypothetical protein